MKQYRYVMAASDGTSYDYARGGNFEGHCFDLPELLRDGWVPVREIHMGQGVWQVGDEPITSALALILLEKDFPARPRGD